METARGPEDVRDETPGERADRNWLELLQEFRVLQAGTQILTGFLLALAFQPSFDDLSPELRFVYLALVVIASVTTITALAPVVMHRLAFRQQVKAEIVTFGHVVMIVTLAMVSLLVVGVAAFVFAVVLTPLSGAIVAAIIGIVVIIAWLIIPRVLRARWE